MGLQGLLGVHVNVGPGLVVGPDGQQGEVEGPVFGSDIAEATGIAGVTAEVDPVLGPDHGEGRPQRVVARKKTSRKVPRGSADQFQITDPHAGIPIQFHHARCRNSPLTQMRAHPQRGDERSPLGSGQRPNGVHVEVVVVVVADHHGIQGGKRLEGKRGRV